MTMVNDDVNIYIYIAIVTIILCIYKDCNTQHMPLKGGSSIFFLNRKINFPVIKLHSDFI